MSTPGSEAPDTGRVADPARLEAVRRSGLLAATGGFDRYTRLARAAIHAPMVLFSVLDAASQHFPAQIGLGEPWAGRRSTPLSHSYCRLVVGSDDDFVVDDATSDTRALAAPASPDLAVAAYAGVPVHDPGGMVLGAFCAIDHQPRAWSDDELIALRDVVASLEAELALRATGEELSRRLGREQAELRLEQRLNEVATAANRVDGIQAVADALVAHGPGVVGATTISLALTDAERVELHHGPGAGAEIAAVWPAADPRSRDPLVTASLEQRPIVLADPNELAAWPAIGPAVAALGLRSLACLPVADPASGLRAAVSFGWDTPLASGLIPPGSRRLAALTTHALARAARFDQQETQSRALEQVVIPSALPLSPGVRITGAYLAPSTGQRVGGDLYDAVVRDDGAIGVVIADAVGHDLEATRAAARVRHAVGMLTVEQVGPAGLLESVNSYVLRSLRSRLVTCAYLLVDPGEGLVTVASAGHPQPRLVRRGVVTPIGPLGDPLLGMAPQTYREGRVVLEPGDVIVGFTDGLIEPRAVSILEGEARLDRQLAELAGEPADTIAQELLNEVGGFERRDDIALIVVSYEGHRDPVPPVVELVWPADDVCLIDARVAIRRWLSDHGREALDPVGCLVATELLTNARTASSDGTDVRLQARFDRGDCVITVENAGPAFDPYRAMPGPSSERGRGLALVRHLSRQLLVRVTNHRVLVEARLTDPGVASGRLPFEGPPT